MNWFLDESLNGASNNAAGVPESNLAPSPWTGAAMSVLHARKSQEFTVHFGRDQHLAVQLREDLD